MVETNQKDWWLLSINQLVQNLKDMRDGQRGQWTDAQMEEIRKIEDKYPVKTVSKTSTPSGAKSPHDVERMANEEAGQSDPLQAHTCQLPSKLKGERATPTPIQSRQKDQDIR